MKSLARGSLAIVFTLLAAFCVGVESSSAAFADLANGWTPQALNIPTQADQAHSLWAQAEKQAALLSTTRASKHVEWEYGVLSIAGQAQPLPSLNAPSEERPRVDLLHEIFGLLGLRNSSLPYFLLILVLLLSLGLNARYRQQLWELQNKLSLIVDSTDDAIIAKTLNGEITTWNQGAQRLYGYEAEEVLGQPFSILFPGDYPDESNEILSLIRQGRSVQGLRHTAMNKNGRMLNVSLTATPVLDRQGRIQGGYVIGRDVSSRKEVEEASRTSEARFRALMENSADAVALFDAEGKILHCSGASERILGYRPEELVGRSGFELAHSEDRPMLRTALRQCVTNTRRSVIRFRVWHRSGSCRWLEGVFNNLLNDPDVQAVVNNYRDITQAVAAEEALLK